MGLLQKATEQNINTPESRKSLFPEIKNRLSIIKNTIDFYPTLFKELVTMFSIEKGALLLKEAEMFTLSSIIGFDETTRNRLRMSNDEYVSFKEEQDLKSFKKYFSIREYITLDQIIIIPFTAKGTIKALLLITEFTTEKSPEKSEIEFYANDLEKLYDENPLHKLKVVDNQVGDKKEDISTYVQKIKNSENRVIFLKLNLENLISTLIKSDTLSTSSSIKNSAIKILTSFVKNRGRVFQLHHNDVLITLLDNTDSTNIVVIQQQISTAFKSIFSKKLNSINLNYESLIWKNNSLDTILDHFIQDAPNN